MIFGVEVGGSLQTSPASRILDFRSRIFFVNPARFMFSDSDSSGLKSCRRPGSLCFWYLTRDSGMYTPFFLFQYQQSGLDARSSLKPSALYSFPRLNLRSAYDTMETGLYFFSKYARSFPAAPTALTFSRLQNLTSSQRSLFMAAALLFLQFLCREKTTIFSDCRLQKIYYFLKQI